MFTFEQARAIVEAKLLPEWDYGNLYVPDWGWQTDQYWVVPAGAREWLKEGDSGMASIDDRMFLVDKKTGDYIEAVAYLNFDLMDQMKPYGEIPKDFD